MGGDPGGGLRDPQLFEFLRQAVGSSLGPIAFTALDGRFKWVNASFLRLFGYESVEELRGTSVRALADEPTNTEATLETLRTLGTWSGVGALRKRDGSPFTAEVRASLVRDDDGKPVGVFASVADVTQREQADATTRRANEALRENEERLTQAVRVAGFGIFDHDLVSGVVYWSPRQREIYGFGPDEPVTFEQFFACLHPDDRERIGALVRRGHDPSGDGLFDAEHRIIRRDGAVRWLLARSQTLFDGPPGARRPVRTAGALLDITEERRLDAERESMRAQLEQAQRLESVGRLAGGVAHDFNNMLAVILGFAEVIRARLPEGASMLEDVKEIEHAAGRARDVTRQLLAFSRKQVIAPRPLDLNAAIAQARKSLAHLIGEDVEMSVVPARDLWLVRLDPSQVDQILMNLATNARDAMPKGGKLTFETQNVTLDEAYCRLHAGFHPGDYVLLSASDDGAGMDRDTAAHVFEPFFTTKEPGHGTGLGLATVYGIVTQNGGMAHVYSERDRGTAFKLYLPRHVETKTPSDRPEEEPVPLSGGTVLLVEDEAAVRSVASAMLRSLGFTVVSAVSPAAALEIFGRGGVSVDIVLTDVVMPGMSGLELRERLRAMRPEVPVVLMSGYTPTIVARHGLGDGIDFLQKPFDLKSLARGIDAALKGTSRS